MQQNSIAKKGEGSLNMELSPRNESYNENSSGCHRSGGKIHSVLKAALSICNCNWQDLKQSTLQSSIIIKQNIDPTLVRISI